MNNFTTGAYGSIPISIQPQPKNYIAVKQAVGVHKTEIDTKQEGSEGNAWKERVEQTEKNKDGTASNDVTTEKLKEAFKDLESMGLSQGRKLMFEEDKESGKHIIKIIDKDTGELIRQVPPEEIVEMARKLKDFGRGWVDTTG